MQERFDFFHQRFRHAPGFVLEIGADVEGFGFEHQEVGGFEDSVSEIEANTFGVRDGKFDLEGIVVTGRGFIADAAFDDGEDSIARLPMEEREAEMLKECAACSFEEVEVAGVIDVISQCTLGVGDTMGMTKNRHEGV